MRLLDAELPATAAIVPSMHTSVEGSDLLTDSIDLGTAADSVATAMNTEL